MNCQMDKKLNHRQKVRPAYTTDKWGAESLKFDKKCLKG